jgi:hypothetical protein
MLHFPSKLPAHGTNGIPRRSDLNATQQRSASHPVFLKVEEELHDARRVYSDGQEDDLRYALSMVINRVSELVRFSFHVRQGWNLIDDLFIFCSVLNARRSVQDTSGT